MCLGHPFWGSDWQNGFIVSGIRGAFEHHRVGFQQTVSNTGCRDVHGMLNVPDF
jgi:hypothetical protein